MEVQERTGIYVYLYYNRDARKLNKYGDFHYHSKRHRYLLLYVATEDVERVAKELKGLKIVKTVKVSHLDEIDRDFVGNLERQEAAV